MPHLSHPAIAELPANSEAIWRYMNFAKFAALLETKSIVFARLDQFGDAFEGTLPLANLSQQMVEGIETTPQIREQVVRMFDVSKRDLFANCWFRSHNESLAMWHLYGGNDSSIAVRSTVGQYKACFDRTDWNVYIGAVQYMDYDTTVMPLGNTFWAALHKRVAFAHENEVRGLIWSNQQNAPNVGDSFAVPIVISLQQLLTEVIVAPNSKPWFHELVSAVLQKYGLTSISLRRSTLDAVPVSLELLKKFEDESRS